MQQTPKRQNIQSTPHRTPIHQTRPYLSIPHSRLNPQNYAYNISQTPHMVDQMHQQQGEVQQGVIYGTNISMEATIRELTKFIEEFQILGEDGQGNQIVYKNRLEDFDLDLIEKNILEINGNHLLEWDSNLYYQLVFYPAQVITLLDQVVKNIYQKQFIDTESDQSRREVKQAKRNSLMVSIIKLLQVNYMRGLGEKHINRLICFRGIVIRCSEIFPEMKTAMFQCFKCKAEVSIQLQNAKVQQPKTCTNCKQRQTFQIVHKYCNFTDKQYVKFQQLPEFVPEGQTPTSLNIVCYDNNVNGMRPGDRVEIVGIFRCQPRKTNRMRCNVQTIFYTFTDLISFRVLQENRFKASLADFKTHFDDDDKQKFYQIASSERVIDDLVQGFASSIFGHQNIKKGLLTQIFGGSHKEFEGRGRFRSDINICLVGDPSTAKSQLLKQVHSIAPRGIYTSGKGSSAVGLTANVRKDPQSRQFILQSGALVLSDLGICCIDQFDKMDQNSKLILLEAMEQQTISIAKAGIVCQLNSRTSILSAANPVLSKYDMKRSVVQNINLPPALLSRFDLIYIILDIPNQQMDKRLAKHILSLYSGIPIQKDKLPKISRNLLAKYITYAKQYVTPRISEGAGKKLTECYLLMRKVGHGRGTVSATPRQLQSLIRISEAFAKMKLSSSVSQDDVMMAFELIQDALKQSATDPTTGMIDMDVIVTGQTSASRKRVQNVVQIFKDLFQANASDYMNKKIGFEKSIDQVSKKWKSTQIQVRPRQQDIKQALFKLQKQGLINLFGSDRNHRPTFKYLNQGTHL